VESFGKAKWNVHGHTHEKPPYAGPYINVSVEHTDYTPRALEDVAKQVGETVTV
jgi:calcineurin-like phosphoesterase family protein